MIWATSTAVKPSAAAAETKPTSRTRASTLADDMRVPMKAEARARMPLTRAAAPPATKGTSAPAATGWTVGPTWDPKRNDPAGSPTGSIKPLVGAAATGAGRNIGCGAPRGALPPPKAETILLAMLAMGDTTLEIAPRIDPSPNAMTTS